MLNLNWLIWGGAFLTTWATKLAKVAKAPPEKTGLALRHKNGLSTTFDLYRSTTAVFSEKRQAIYLRF